MFEELGVLYRGMILGLMIAAPVGPVGLMCIRRTVRSGMFLGFATGFGAAFADAIFGAVAAFGVAAIIDLIKEYTRPIHVLGGVFMLVAAWRTWHDKPRQPTPEMAVELREAAASAAPAKRVEITAFNAVKAILGSFAVTATNPVTLFGTLAVVATLGGLRSGFEASTMVMGIFLGSALWWLMLSGGVALLCRNIAESGIIKINKVTAVALAALAAWILAVGIAEYMGYEMPGHAVMNGGSNFVMEK